MRLWSEAHPYECNDWAIHNSLQEWKLQLSEVLNFQEFLFDEENAVGLKAFGGSVSLRDFEAIFVNFQTLDFRFEGLCWQP
jgi:hypothetical protein